jgi:hypothetical protein
LSESKQQELAAGPVGAVAAAQLYDASHDLIGGKTQRGGDVFGSTQKFVVSGRHEDVLPFGAPRWVTPSVKIWPSSQEGERSPRAYLATRFLATGRVRRRASSGLDAFKQGPRTVAVDPLVVGDEVVGRGHDAVRGVEVAVIGECAA